MDPKIEIFILKLVYADTFTLFGRPGRDLRRKFQSNVKKKQKIIQKRRNSRPECPNIVKVSI
jgi:hypothetical protein